MREPDGHIDMMKRMKTVFLVCERSGNGRVRMGRVESLR